MYKYSGYVSIKETGALLPFRFEAKKGGYSEEELLSLIGQTLNNKSNSINWVEEYKVTKK